MNTPRSWLYAPGHSEKLLTKVFEASADAVVLDLEDAVPPQLKSRARKLVAEVASSQACWVRINRAMSAECQLDLEAVAAYVSGFRLPKVESAAEVEWVAERAPGVKLDCSIESARGVLAAEQIAASSKCSSLSYGGLDLQADLGISGGDHESLFARSLLVVASRAGGKPPPSDGVYSAIDDLEGLRYEANRARRMGFWGKSAIHPHQVPVINQVFTPSAEELAWAKRVLAVFDAAGGAATKVPGGEFVDKAVAERARRLLDQSTSI